MLTKIRNRMKNKKYYHNHNKFKVAFKGIRDVYLEESSFRYQIILLIIAIVLGAFFRLSSYEWLVIVFAAIIVFTVEIINTAIENIIDLISPEYNALAGKIKDISAGAVLICALGAVVIGVIIFYPKILSLL